MIGKNQILSVSILGISETSNKPHKFGFDLHLNFRTVNQNLAIRFHRNAYSWDMDHDKRLPLLLPLSVCAISSKDQRAADTGEESPFHNP